MRLEGLDQVVTRCLRFFTFVAESIIHRPSIHHPQSFRIDNDGLCSPFDSKAACHLLGVIIQDRQGDFKIFSLTLQVRISILGIGVEQPEGDSLGGIGRSQSVELLIALAHQRASHPMAEQHDGLGLIILPVVGKLTEGSLVVQQTEILNGLLLQDACQPLRSQQTTHDNTGNSSA